jgi:hypothetical protein
MGDQTTAKLTFVYRYIISSHLIVKRKTERRNAPINDHYSRFFKICTCSITALLLVPPVAFFNSTARS